MRRALFSVTRVYTLLFGLASVLFFVAGIWLLLTAPPLASARALGQSAFSDEAQKSPKIESYNERADSGQPATPIHNHPPTAQNTANAGYETSHPQSRLRWPGLGSRISSFVWRWFVSWWYPPEAIKLFTFFLVVVGLVQGVVLYFTRVDTQKTADAVTRVAKAAEDNSTAARAALELAKRNADDTRETIAVARETADAAKTSAEAAKAGNELVRRTLLITQRPILSVRNVVVKNPQPIHEPPDPRLFRPNEYVSGQLYVSNKGGTRATVTESLCWVWCNQGALPHARPYEGANANNPIAVGSVIEPGERGITIFFSSHEPLGSEADHIWQGGQDWHLYVMGWIEYTDEIPSLRRMAFCRAFSISDGRRFISVENRDYEYGDE